MVWSVQDHGMAIMKYSMIMAWQSWKIRWSYHGDNGYHFNIVHTLTIQSTLLISNQVVVRNFLRRSMLNEPIKTTQNTFNQNKSLSQKFEITKNNEYCPKNFAQKINEENADHTMIMLWIMTTMPRNMAAKPSS